VLYNSIYRADDEMLVNPHVYGTAAAQAPVVHLQRHGDSDLFNTYVLRGGEYLFMPSLPALKWIGDPHHSSGPD
jgi:hypothetical protein